MPAGSLTLWRWHARTCPHRTKGRRWTRCNCGIWVQGSLGGEWIKRSLNTRSWTAAAATVHGWEASGQIGVVKLDTPTVEQAVDAYFEDATARHLAETTIRKRRELLEGKLLTFCRAQGLSLLKQLDVANPAQIPERLAVLGLVGGEAVGVPAGLPPLLQGLGLARHQRGHGAEAAQGVAAAHAPVRRGRDDADPHGRGRPRRAGVVSDRKPARWCCSCATRACGCRTRPAWNAGGSSTARLFLYTQKTGTPVYCPLPPDVGAALDAVKNAHADYVFWDDKSTRETTVKSWNRVFNKLFAAAAPPIEGGHPHRFRDTFAVSLLLKGVSLESVSKLLGHTSIKVTERHYAPWVKARQDQLESDVRRIWE